MSSKVIKPRARATIETADVPIITNGNGRTYWQGAEAEEVIRRTAAGEAVADVSERLDVLVDPETAMLWLRRNHHNRNVSNNLIERFTADMAAGKWPYTHQGIAFDRHGELIDGQHRLHAIIRSGCSVGMQVTINMPVETSWAIDQGKPRNVADIATLESHTKIENKMAAVAAKMSASVNRTKARGTRTEQVDFVLRHIQAIAFAVEQLPDRAQRIAYAATRAVIARAYYTVDRTVLERFCAVLRDGGNVPGETIAFMLREFVMQKGCRSLIDAQDVYCKTEWALKRFIDKQPSDRLRPAEHEQFLLPEES